MALATLLDFSVLTLLAIGLAVYVAVGALYRLAFHPLRRIPGPKLAALTYLYEIYYDVLLPGQYNFRIMDLHKEYGPILRINPDEVHVADKDFLGEIYGSRRRNRLYERSLDTADSVAGTTHYDLHKTRRQAMTNFFSPKAVKQLEPLLAKKRDILQDAVNQHLSTAKQGGSSQPLNLSDLYFAFCWDLIQEYTFAFESNVLLNPAEAHKLRSNSTDLLLQVNFTRHFAWVNSIAAMLPEAVAKKLTPPGVIDLKELAVRVRKNVDEVLEDEKTTNEDIAEETQHRSIFYTIRDDDTLPMSEKSALRLQREGWFLVVAGSDTPARVLAIIHFHLLDNKEYMTRLREELRPLGSQPSLDQLEKLPFLDACIVEGCRLGFGLSRRNSRVAPEDTMVYAGYEIPPGFPVSTSTLAVHADETIFPDPYAFKPDRWLAAEAGELRKYLMSFGAKGPRSCLGIHLAHAELSLGLAAMAKFEMDLFETSVRDIEYKHDFQMPQGNLKSQGVRAQVQGIAEGF